MTMGSQLWAQIKGVGIVGVYSAVVTLIVKPAGFLAGARRDPEPQPVFLNLHGVGNHAGGISDTTASTRSRPSSNTRLCSVWSSVPSRTGRAAGRSAAAA